MRDYLGNPVTARSGTTLDRINDFIEGYLAYETRAELILAAAEADPESCMANVYAGTLWMLLEAPEARFACAEIPDRCRARGAARDPARAAQRRNVARLGSG